MDIEAIEVEILKNLKLSSNGRSFIYSLPESEKEVEALEMLAEK
jgi:hypothetical protein